MRRVKGLARLGTVDPSMNKVLLLCLTRKLAWMEERYIEHGTPDWCLVRYHRDGTPLVPLDPP